MGSDYENFLYFLEVYCGFFVFKKMEIEFFNLFYNLLNK